MYLKYFGQNTWCIFCIFNNKIQNTLFTENYYIIRTSRTNESQISHIKLFDQLFSSCCQILQNTVQAVIHYYHY